MKDLFYWTILDMMNGEKGDIMERKTKSALMIGSGAAAAVGAVLLAGRGKWLILAAAPVVVVSGILIGNGLFTAIEGD